MTIASATLVDEILGELAPLISRRQRAMAFQWCRRSLSMTHLHVLLLLHTEGAVSMSRLADLLDVSLPNVTGIVGRMEERGLVERTHDQRDRRIVQVQLAESGRLALEEMNLMRKEHFGRVLEELTPDQQRTCLRTVRDVRAAYERLAARGELDHDHRTNTTRSDQSR